jgi:DNA-directed RNA polymerase subunit RPC12/RpoP
MEIISMGKDPQKVKYVGTCRTCGTRVKFERREAEYHSDQRDGDYLSVKCPECQSEIYASVKTGVAW